MLKANDILLSTSQITNNDSAKCYNDAATVWNSSVEEMESCIRSQEVPFVIQEATTSGTPEETEMTENFLTASWNRNSSDISGKNPNYTKIVMTCNPRKGCSQVRDSMYYLYYVGASVMITSIGVTMLSKDKFYLGQGLFIIATLMLGIASGIRISATCEPSLVKPFNRKAIARIATPEELTNKDVESMIINRKQQAFDVLYTNNMFFKK